MASSRSWEDLSRDSALVLLPVAAAVALLLGSFTLLGILPALDRYLPLASVALAIVALWGVLTPFVGALLLRSNTRVDPEEARGVAGVPRARFAGPTPTPPGRSSPVSGIGRAATYPSAKAGDELWHHWAAPRSAPLGAPLVGPVRETAYQVPRSETMAAFPTMDQDIMFLSDSLTRSGGSRPTRAPRPEASRWVANLSGAHAARRVPPTRASMRGRATVAPPGSRAAPSLSDIGPGTLGHPSVLPILDTLDHPEELVSPPVPPTPGPRHRTWDPEARETGDATRSEAKSLARWCHDCSRHLTDFREWVHCRRCHAPVCRDCLSDSFAGADGGVCADCREAAVRPLGRPTGPLRPARSSAGT